jgi:hypothetical protein
MSVHITNRPPAVEAAARLIETAHISASECGCGQCASEVNAGACPMPQPEFPRFFAGQCVQPADLTAIEKRDFLHEQLRARHTIGWGISCGFRIGLDGTVNRDKNTVALGGATVRVEAGYGIDRYGRDVYLAANLQFSLETLLAERAARIKKALADPWCAIPGCQPSPPAHYCIAVRYKECEIAPVPSYAQQCGTPKTLCEYSRIREDVEIRIFGDNEFPPIPANAPAGSWCGLPPQDQTLLAAFLSAIEIPHGSTDVASSSTWKAYTNLAGNVAGLTAAAFEQQQANCEDLLHASRPCEPCMDWPWIPLACFTIDGTTVSAPDCRVRRTIYSLQEMEALIVRVFCYLVHEPRANTGAGTNSFAEFVNLFR